MTTARRELVDPSLTRWYYCVCRCVRHMPLLAEGTQDRKLWIEKRLEELSEIYAISVGAYSVLDDRVLVLLRLDPDSATRWSNTDVVRRYARLHPPRNKDRAFLPVTDAWVRSKARDTAEVAHTRQRLTELGWFMKSLKEPLSRIANVEDDSRGAFFEGRFKSIAILDDSSLATSFAYIDLSGVVAGSTSSVTASPYTSIRLRYQHIKATGHLDDLKPTRNGSGTGARTSLARVEASHWLCPIEGRSGARAGREGAFERLSLRGYLLLLEYSVRARRETKSPATISPELASVFDRIGIGPDEWRERLARLTDGRLFGRFYAATRERLQNATEHLGIQRAVNLDGSSMR